MKKPSCVRGGCLCGAVRFEADLPSKWCAHCHCSMCRKAHGAGYVTWVGFHSAHFRLVAGDQHLRWYQSSPGARRGFCKTCGSSMFFEENRNPGETCITLTNIDDPIDRAPEMHAHYDNHVDWIPVDDALSAFRR
ncbi:MAG: GFA family protein [Xanthomonadales bacterium]|nr:GFA family protein [Xanthomonadales bacterium]